MNNYTATTNTQGQIIVKKQTSVLNKALLVAGAAFILLFLFSYSLFQLLSKYLHNPSSGVLNGLYAISVIGIIVVIIMSIVVSAKLPTIKISTIIWMIALYTIFNGIMFGILFYSIQNSVGTNFNVKDILYCFLITGAIFTISGLVGSILSVRFTLSLGRFLMIATFALMIFMFFFWIISLFAFHHNFEKTNMIILFVWGLLMLGYIAFDISVIKKSDSFAQILDSQTQTKFVFLFGFMLLVDLINMLWIVIRLYIAFKR